ncbi:lysophospholipid acyltransferase family protein [Candidatus Pantoea multigeneris]|uniref:L-ornithine N(alpha)-acyltransferase n=1 Tax=Candidatus Pantoea multigeneris TaxID=2608357 RepID=A0ABX0RAC2_9GAMM|nr:GNAT family N-acyltransferase [Pantoea multigeneris]NIF21287.1 GNAT family N-acetyltransferase [Pantoea multigeneris]
MFSIEQVLQDLRPNHTPAAWQLRLLKWALREQEFQDFAARHPHLKGVDMVEQILDHLSVRCELADRDREQIPPRGPAIIVANHPLGALDGLALLLAVSKVRPDTKIVANRVLMALESINSLMLPVDNMSSRTSRDQLQQMQNHLENQGVLIVFPAGEVSRMGSQGIRDNKWHHSFLRLAARARAPLVPVHVAGRNSTLFYAVAKIIPPMALLMLVREMFRKRGSEINLRIGEQIPFSSWHDGHTPGKELAKRLRKHVYRLGQNKPGLFQTESAIALAEDRAELKQALKASEKLGTLPDGKEIFLWRRNGETRVPLLRELGRLREIAFRAVGEGSGRRRDLDSYDDDYYHLILWDDAALEIVGAYRFIPGDEQLTRRGLEGFYSHSLFHYDERMMPILQHSIELGRSFIQPAYWGKRGLDYLWLGIGAYLAKYPQTRYLFGPVSISGGLPLAARDLLVAFYRLYFPTELPLATSRRPYPASLPEVLAQFSGDNYQEDLTRLKQMLNNLGTAIPTLYKQYSELCEPGGVQFIDFGSDPDFNNCIDGLVLVDITRLKPARYARYIEVHQAEKKPEQG